MAMLTLNTPALDDQVWKVIPFAINYEISEFGLIRRLTSVTCGKAGKLIASHPNRDGYLVTHLSIAGGKSITPAIHVAVLRVYKGEKPKKHQAAHIDGNQLNNHYSNLKWVTAQVNADHKKMHGTVLFGEEHGQAKLAECDVVAIKGLLGSERQCDIARRFSVSRAAIWDIKTGRRWRHI